MAIKKILFPTKFRELSFDALESLFVLKEAGLTEVVFLNVIPREDVGFVPFGGYLKEEEKKLKEESRIRFDNWERSLQEIGIESKVIINVGEPVHEILSVAEEEKVDMIVVGRKKRINIEEIFIGSYTHNIITRSKLPVLASKYMVEFKWDDAVLTKVNDKLFELPLIVVGWSELSQRVIKFVEGLSGVVKKINVFYNIDVKSLKEEEQAVSRIEKETMAGLQNYCERLRNAGIEADPLIGAGELLDEILRVSRAQKSSMIIIGDTAEKRILDKMLHRSISYQVVKASELPTLLVP